jgi:hypothetical protein
MVREEIAQAFNVIAPVLMQLAGHTEPVHQLRARSGHPCPGGLADGRIERAGGVGHDEDLIARFKCGERDESDAHVRDHAGDDQLAAPGRLDGLDVLVVIPGIDLAGAE